MNELNAVSAIGELGTDALAARGNALLEQMQATSATPSTSKISQADFAAMVTEGIARMDTKVAHADEMVTRFAIDGDTPIHQVTIALEEARLSVELAMQVRQRFVEGYRELMNMQL